MSDTRLQNFVLIHGAWFGGWAWRDTLQRLHALGHTATAPTLTGLGERRHTGNDTADLETHIEDVVAHIEMEDLHDITLVGWSYGGMVATGVLARISERVSRLIYLDAFVPADGQALVDLLPPEARQAWDMLKDRDHPLPPLPLDGFGVTDPAIVASIEPRLVRQPWRTVYQPVKALRVRPNIPMTYVVCTRQGQVQTAFTARLTEMGADPTIRVETIATSHMCMFTALDETIDILVGR